MNEFISCGDESLFLSNVGIHGPELSDEGEAELRRHRLDPVEREHPFVLLAARQVGRESQAGASR